MEEVVESADALFKKVGNAIKLILGDDSSLYDNEQAYETISTIEKCKERVDNEHLFSVNEQIDDINTLTLKFLFLSYYAGKCYQSIRDMESRLINILAAKDEFTTYLQACTRLGVLQKEDCDTEEKMTADAKRQHKIETFKRDRAAKKRINELQRLLYITKNDTDIDHEEEMRELFLTQLQCYARESRDEIDMIQQEVIMLRYQEQQLQQKQAAEGARSTDARMMDDRSRGTSGGGVYVDNYNTPTHQQGPGISVTRTFKVGDQIMFSRETVKATVFGSSIAPPSMSLEEFGDQQKAEAIERQAREQEAAENGAARSGRRYKQLLEDGDEDDADLVDQAAEKDRAWDDWKDNNPRGWGNKMGKRF